MRISPISNNLYFKSNERKVVIENTGKTVAYDIFDDYDPLKVSKVRYSNYTNFFRPDLNSSHSDKYFTSGTWLGFCRTIADEFKNQPIVHTYDFGCSDGSEPYSLALGLIKFIGEEKAEKFFPIKACDMDKTIIDRAQKGEILCDKDDLVRLQENAITNPKTPYYTIYDTGTHPNYPYVFVPQKQLMKKVNFEVDTLLSGIQDIEKSSSFVLCRNFWPYMSDKEIWLAAQKLAQQLDDTSLVVIGGFDKFHTYSPFRHSGFEEIYPLVFKKVNEAE